MADHKLQIDYYKMYLGFVSEKAEKLLSEIDKHADHLDQKVKEGSDETYYEQLMTGLLAVINEGHTRIYGIGLSLLSYLTEQRRKAEEQSNEGKKKKVLEDELELVKKNSDVMRAVRSLDNETSCSPLLENENSIEPLLTKENSFRPPVGIVDSTTITIKPAPENNYGRKPYSFPWPRKKEDNGTTNVETP